MFKFDESFLEQVGLKDMPEEQKRPFLEYAQDQLEVRIGEKISEGLSEAQLSEFEKLVDNDQAAVQDWLLKLGDYKSDEVYQKLLENNGNAGENAEMLNDFVTAKWLEKNCPQYSETIRKVMGELQEEIASQKDEILAGAAK